MLIPLILSIISTILFSALGTWGVYFKALHCRSHSCENMTSKEALGLCVAIISFILAAVSLAFFFVFSILLIRG
jgi:hypothetical protein